MPNLRQLILSLAWTIFLTGGVTVTLTNHSPGAENGPSIHGKLRVDGTRLTNERGEPIQLRGMSSHGLRWYPEYINYGAMRDIKARGANLFRLAMYADSDLGGYNESPEAKTASKQLMYLGIENALAADLYVIVDWHLLKDENPLRNVSAALEFFDEVSSRYGDCANIIYEICNEPNGATTWEEIGAYARTVIPAIRKNAPDAVVVVGTPRWSSDLMPVPDARLDFPNVMYAYHMYTGNSDYEFIWLLDKMREEGVPVFVSEWGLSMDEQTGALDTDEAYAFVAYMREHGLSWSNWSLCNKDEEFSAIRPEVTKLHGWTDEDLTESGRLTFAAFSDE